jgi:hypothetical protein
MSRSESYHCDICGKLKNDSEIWWMSWIDCFRPDGFQGNAAAEDQPLLKLTRWQPSQAHADGVKHLCGARCSETMIDRWIASQREDPDAHCET